MHILLTGAAGFIGYSVATALLARGDTVHGIDNLSPYYDVRLKEARLERLKTDPKFTFSRLDIVERETLAQLFSSQTFDVVVHLAAQAGVRYSIENPQAYGDANLAGFLNILEGCRHAKVKHLVYASSSSVYGSNAKLPFAEDDNVDHPISLYAATKKANELMAHSYAHLFGLPVTMLRYFTVYGPWGRPDMAIWKFSDGLLSSKPIDVFAGGHLSRDFTHVDDAADATVALLGLAPQAAAPGQAPAAARPDASWAPFRVLNVGRSDPVTVNELIGHLERLTGARAIRRELPMQPGDVERTCADPSALRALTGFEPRVALADGLASFVDWFRGWRTRSR